MCRGMLRRTLSKDAHLGLRIVLGPASAAPAAGACPVGIAHRRHLPNAAHARKALRAKDVLIVDEAAEVDELPSCLNRLYVAGLKSLGKDSRYLRLDDPALRSDHLRDSHRRKPLRVLARLTGIGDFHPCT